MTVNDYAEQVVNNFITDITDHIFVNIERNDGLMREYMSKVKSFGLDNVNMAIGKKVKDLLNLKNSDQCRKPQSRLITTYTRHGCKRTRGVDLSLLDEATP